LIDGLAFDALRGTSREFHLACDREGRVLFSDERARRIVGVQAGDSLRELVAPGCDDKFNEFLRRGCREDIANWEIPFIVDGKHVAAALCSSPHDAGLLVIGYVTPEDYAAALTQVSEMVSEVVGLNRVALAQRNELAVRHSELMRVNTELTESHQGVLVLHRELQMLTDQTRRDHDVQARLIANTSHELRTPLHSILGLTRLVASDPLTTEQQKQVQFIRTSAEELLALVDDVLDLGRLDAGRAPAHIERFELSDFIASMRGVLRPLVPNEGPVRLAIEDAPDAPTLNTDRTKLSQIVRNLVSNALKFTEHGEVRMRTAVDAGLLTIEVSDTGIGIAPGDVDTIFETYGQVQSPRQTSVKGSGLGLPLSLKLAERLGGTLRVRDRVSSGSTFVVVVPVCLLDVAP
jgi:signal transduction histidine kinase